MEQQFLPPVITLKDFNIGNTFIVLYADLGQRKWARTHTSDMDVLYKGRTALADPMWGIPWDKPFPPPMYTRTFRRAALLMASMHDTNSGVHGNRTSTCSPSSTLAFKIEPRPTQSSPNLTVRIKPTLSSLSLILNMPQS